MAEQVEVTITLDEAGVATMKAPSNLALAMKGFGVGRALEPGDELRNPGDAIRCESIPSRMQQRAAEYEIIVRRKA